MKSLMVIAFCAIMADGYAQTKFFTRSGKISFFSRSLIENIEAVNKSVTCVMDISTGNIQSVLKMRGFSFRKSLMQDHFNENYVESDKYPQAEFKGKVDNNEQVNYAADGIYDAHVSGTLQMHGQTNPVEANGTISVSGATIVIVCPFKILLNDYKIDIPSLVKDNISNTIAVTVSFQLEPLK